MFHLDGFVAGASENILAVGDDFVGTGTGGDAPDDLIGWRRHEYIAVGGWNPKGGLIVDGDGGERGGRGG